MDDKIEYDIMLDAGGIQWLEANTFSSDLVLRRTYGTSNSKARIVLCRLALFLQKDFFVLRRKRERVTL